MRNISWTILGFALMSFAGCGDNQNGGESDTGQVALKIAQAPTDVHCLVVTAASASRTVQRDVDVTPGQSVTAPLSGLPTGSVSLGATAYAEACSAVTSSSVPTWLSDPPTQTMTLVRGTVVPWTIVLRPNGEVSPTVDWEDDSTSAGGAGTAGATSTGGSSATGGATAVGTGGFAQGGATGSGAVAVAVGEYHTCALLSGGTVACWGDNRWGELGNGTTTNSPTPVAVAGLSGVSAISVGGPFTWTILSDGNVDVWGYDGYSQFGDGNYTQIQATPLPIPGLNGMTGVVAGGNFSCAMVSGAVECWGYNGDGELGNGTYGGGTPQTVSLNSPVAVAAGNQHSCALLSNGTAQCWGRNVEGQLGNGTMTTNSPTPTTVSGLVGSTAIAPGWDHTCALLSNGSVQCWGANNYGQLGNGASISGSSVPVAVSSLSGAVAVAAGSSHTCALLSEGSIACWGMNAQGELGNGTTTDSATPVTVSGVTGAKAIAAAHGDHTCALLSDGSITCWGDNSYGQLGNGTTTDSPTPVAVKW